MFNIAIDDALSIEKENFKIKYIAKTIRCIFIKVQKTHRIRYL